MRSLACLASHWHQPFAQELNRVPDAVMERIHPAILEAAEAAKRELSEAEVSTLELGEDWGTQVWDGQGEGGHRGRPLDWSLHAACS